VSFAELGAASAVIGLGSLLQGAIGFGALLVAAPFLVLIEPDLVPGPVLVPAFALTSLVAWRERGALVWSAVGWAVAGRVPGSAAGAELLASVPGDTLELLVGVAVLIGVLASVTPLRVAPTRAALALAGFTAGVMGTATSIGGPPVALVYQHQSGAELRATLSAFFLVGVVLSAATLAVVGRFGPHQIGLGLSLVPATLAGYAASAPLARLLDRGFTRPAVLALCAAAGAVLLLRRAF
jgi:uncharacterized membrane protein YfcA